MIGGPCTLCKTTHDPERVRIGARVIVVGDSHPAGAVGRVLSWTVYGTPLTLRVVFDRGVLDPDEPGHTRENFYPCELLYVGEPG